ncbi:MAG: helix-turn-helix domain-containing protein [Opitutales bacterium]
MQTIGERLEEARKRKGISLREAAEATKIRGDFLSSIEQSKFDFDLPEIYKRGFLKNYARYLKLDADKILTDYNAQQLTNSRLGKKSGSEWFGQMEVKKPEKAEKAEAGDAPAEREEPVARGHIYKKPGTASEEARRLDEPADREDESDKTFYLKIGLIFVGTLALVFVVFGLIWAILGSGSGDDDSSEIAEAPEIRETTPSIRETLGAEFPEPPAGSDSITLTASGNVNVLVRQKEDNAELYRNVMGQGESVTLEKSGPVDILFTAGQFLTIEHDGERFRPSEPGSAKITIP